MTTNLFKNKYRISSSRLQSWDYAKQGIYFVTICTSDRNNYFGNIIDNRIELTEIGRIVESEWVKTIELRKDMNLQIGDYVVMPNHFHGILIIGKNQFNRRDAIHRVPAKKSIDNKFGAQSKNLAAIIRGFKAAISSYAKRKNINFGWQPSFHEHIVRSYEEFDRISAYIQKNPEKWIGDRFNPENQR